MRLVISQRDGVPIYQQIVNQVKHLVAAGRIQPHEELPAVRVLAQQLLINPNTVARAYRELERDGVVYKRRGAGTYVSERESLLAEKERRRIIAERVDTLLVEARHLDFDLETVIALLRERAAGLPDSDREGSA